MSTEKEKFFLEKLDNEAEKGIIITAETVRKRAEEHLGCAVSEDYAYDLIHRDQWKK